MNTIKIEVTDSPSNSKGWARYAVSQDTRKVVQSTTGNEWVGKTTKEGVAEEGSFIRVRSQVMLRVGKGRHAREEVTTREYLMVVQTGAVSEINHRPGSQGQTLRVTGARLADTEAAMDAYDAAAQ